MRHTDRMSQIAVRRIDFGYVIVPGTPDAAEAPHVLPCLGYVGSLGDEVLGRDGFRGHRDKIRAAFPDFHNEVVDLVVGDGKAAARLLYTGTHMGEALGVPASGAAISYSGAAFFSADGGRLRQAWVLGDLDQLRRQLTGSG